MCPEIRTQKGEKSIEINTSSFIAIDIDYNLSNSN